MLLEPKCRWYVWLMLTITHRSCHSCIELYFVREDGDESHWTITIRSKVTEMSFASLCMINRDAELNYSMTICRYCHDDAKETIRIVRRQVSKMDFWLQELLVGGMRWSIASGAKSWAASLIMNSVYLNRKYRGGGGTLSSLLTCTHWRKLFRMWVTRLTDATAWQRGTLT